MFFIVSGFLPEATQPHRKPQGLRGLVVDTVKAVENPVVVVNVVVIFAAKK